MQLPWLELDWFMDLSSRIVHLDLSWNLLVALPSVLPWGLLHLQTLDLSNNLLKELPAAPTSQEVVCTRYVFLFSGCPKKASGESFKMCDTL